MSQMANKASVYPSSSSMKWLQVRVFLLPPGWDASTSQGYPLSIRFAGTHLYTWVARDPVRVKRLAQEHNSLDQVHWPWSHWASTLLTNKGNFNSFDKLVVIHQTTVRSSFILFR